ncbi:type IV toxin-antitoxin system YeeU family antitoxin [Aeromonas veronii]
MPSVSTASLPSTAGFTCESGTLGCHGYVYIAIYSAISADITH